MTISTTVLLQWVSAGFSGVAAILWWVSARVSLPTRYVLEGVYPSGPHEPRRQQKLDPVVSAIRKQSQWSAAGAVCAGLASACQAAAIWFG
jgi:hypothetical protein